MGVRSTMLELAILGELEEPMHGYELRQRLSEAIGPVRRLSFGSLYPALHRLSETGLIATVTSPETEAPTVTNAGSPATTSPTNSSTKTKKSKSTKAKTPRRQVIYRITPAGAEFLQSNLQDASVDDESLPLTMRLMSKAPAATRLALLKERRSQVLARREANQTASLSKDSWISARAELNAQQDENELNWLDRLIASTIDDSASERQSARRRRRPKS